jgi:hypothetical protein
MTTTSRHPTRARGANVRLLDLSQYEHEALEFANAHRDDDQPPYTKATVEQAPLAVGFSPNGTAYLIGVEGVGWPLDDDGEEFDVYVSTDTSFSIFPTVAFTLTREQINDALGDEVDLADHVRVFGARLEANFRLWFDTLTTPIPKEES